MDLIQRKHPEILAGIGVRYGKSSFRRTKALISLKRSQIGPRLLFGPIGSLTQAFSWCKNQPWMTLNGHRALYFKTRVFRSPSENLMKIDPYFQQRRCSLMTLVSGNLRFMWIFAGVPLKGAIKRQWGYQKHGFSAFVHSFVAAARLSCLVLRSK